MRTVALVSLLALLFALCGCGNKEAQVVGKWKSTGSSASGPGEIELTKDKKFIAAGTEGTWTMSGDQVSVTFTKIAGMPIEDFKKQMAKMPGAEKGLEQMSKPVNFNLSSDGKTLTMVPPPDAPAGAAAITLTKVTS